MNIKIDKGIPISEWKRKPTGKYKQALQTMENGDSFSVKTFSESEAARHAAVCLGCKTVHRRQPDGTYRVWRTK